MRCKNCGVTVESGGWWRVMWVDPSVLDVDNDGERCESGDFEGEWHEPERAA